MKQRLRGALADYANPKLIFNEDSAWKIKVIDRYLKNKN
jgi:hypothetical protein